MRCDECDSFTDNAEDDFGEHICSACIQNRNEIAWERHLEDCAGGAGPMSLREQMEAARRLK